MAVAAYFGFVRGYLNRYGDASQDAIPYAGRKAGRVVVLGCSIAGMSTAKALAPFFEEVLVLERDTLPSLTTDRAETLRGGAAHAPVSHLLLTSGQTILEHLFGPVLFTELLRIGCSRFDICSTMCWNFFSAWKCRAEPNTGMQCWSGSRFAYEQTIRRMLIKDTPNLKLIQQAKNATPIFTQSSPTQRAQLTGVKWHEGKEECTVNCDLMIDATGRSTNLLKWLAPIHVGGAKEEDNTWVDAGVTYTSFVCARDPNETQMQCIPAPDGRSDLPWVGLVCYEDHNIDNRRHFLMWPIEHDRYQLSLGGLNNDQCPTDWDAALEYSKGLADPSVFEVLKTLKPVQWDSASPQKSSGYLYNVPRSTKRPLERMTNFPTGLHVVGDAACCFNPVRTCSPPLHVPYGARMLVAHCSSLCLSACCLLLLSDLRPGNEHGDDRGDHAAARNQDEPAWRSKQHARAASASDPSGCGSHPRSLLVRHFRCMEPHGH